MPWDSEIRQSNYAYEYTFGSVMEGVVAKKTGKIQREPWCFITYRTIPLLPMSD